MSYEDWIRVGMALKGEGYDESIWEEWSSRDAARYHPGECGKKWESFRGSGAPVTAGTIYRLARERGWRQSDMVDGERMRWDEVIRDGAAAGQAQGADPPPLPKNKEKEPSPLRNCPKPEPALGNSERSPVAPAEELRSYLEALFQPGDIVGYVTGDAWQGRDGRWAPGKGVYSRTAGELIESLQRHPDALEYTVGSWNPEAGAWIRFNPLDGKGVRNENVAAFRYALVESDTMEMEAQIRMYRELELPIAAMVSSGGKSIHAIVRIGAEDIGEYRKRVSFLYEYLAAHGVKVDIQNRNPSRLSRMPGVTRGGRRQQLLGTNIGRDSWEEWIRWAEVAADGLPRVHSLAEYAQSTPEMPPELIRGILRQGHKMLISGSSKAGKSFLLIELCISIAEGIPWLGFACRKGKVMYVNLEIDPASCVNRFLQIYRAMKIAPDHMEDIDIWNLRGHAVPLDRLVPRLIRRAEERRPDAIILDPIYKVITGDENSASDMAEFCNQFDRICSELGCAVIYCHHHSKGTQGAKRAMDRASGSGVFARDPDAQLDMIELEMSDEVRDAVGNSGATAWRLESSLREFRNIEPVEFWFDYPIHRLDEGELLSGLPSQGSPEAGRLRNARSKPADVAASEFRSAFGFCSMDESGVSVRRMAEYMGLAERTVRERIAKMGGEFRLENGSIVRAGA